MALSPERKAELDAVFKQMEVERQNKPFSEKTPADAPAQIKTMSDYALATWGNGHPDMACSLGNQKACREVRINQLPRQVAFFAMIIIGLTVVGFLVRYFRRKK